MKRKCTAKLKTPSSALYEEVGCRKGSGEHPEHWFSTTPPPGQKRETYKWKDGDPNAYRAG